MKDQKLFETRAENDLLKAEVRTMKESQKSLLAEVYQYKMKLLKSSKSSQKMVFGMTSGKVQSSGNDLGLECAESLVKNVLNNKELTSEPKER